MHADLLHQRLTEAIAEQRRIVLLLRGAHRVEARDSRIVAAALDGDEARFDIEGVIALDGGPETQGVVSVTSKDVASLFVGTANKGEAS